MAIVLKSPEHKIEIVKQVVNGWREMKEERQELEDTWRKCLMAVLCKFDKKWATYAKQANRSCRYVGLSWDAVETILPQIYNVVFGQDDAQKVRPIRPGMDERDDIYAEMMRHVLIYQMRHGKFKKTARLGFKSMLALGNCPWFADWHVKKAVNYPAYTDAMGRWMEESAKYHEEHRSILAEHEAIQIRAEMLGEKGPARPDFAPPPQPPKDLDIIYEGPRLRIGSIFNYVQEQHPNDEDSALRIMRSFRTKAYLKSMAKPDETGYRLYSNIGKIRDQVSEDTAEFQENESLLKLALGMSMPVSKAKVELKEQHGTFEAGSADNRYIYKDYVCVVANDHELIRCEPSPLFSGKPMVNNAKLITMEGAVYGTGIVEKALDEQYSANATHNQTIDAANAIIQPEYEVIENQVIDGEMKPSGPGVRHSVTDLGTINPIPKNFQGIPIGFAAVNAAIARHERMTGAINTAPSGDETATKTARNTNVIATKMGGHVLSCEDEFVTPALDMFLEMNAQYLEGDQIISITQDGRNADLTVPPSAIRRGWYVYATGSKYLAEKQERIQNLMMALQMAEQRAASGQPSPVYEDELWRRMFKEILDTADDIVMPKEEYEAKLQQFRQEQQQLMLMQANGGQNGQQGQDRNQGATPGNQVG